MATLAYSNCPKTFKTQTGFTWHLAHAHLSPVEEGQPVVEIPALKGVEVKGLPVIADLIENKLEVLHREILKEVGDLLAAYELDSENDDSVQECLTRVVERTEKLEASAGSFGGLKSEVQNQERGIASLKRQLAERDAVIASLCRLVLKLDMDHKQRHTFADLAVDRSEATVNGSRNILLNFLAPVLLA